MEIAQTEECLFWSQVIVKLVTTEARIALPVVYLSQKKVSVSDHGRVAQRSLIYCG